jgi:uncharacterized protein YuzE
VGGIGGDAMRYEYDLEADAMYVYMSDAPIDHTEQLEDGTIVDVAADGTLVGIEVISVQAGWSPDVVTKRFTLSDYDKSMLFQMTHSRHTTQSVLEPAAADSAVIMTSNAEQLQSA